jgi:hypothetical protein
MEVYIRTICITCFGLEIICDACDNTGKISKWLPVSAVAEEIRKLQETTDWATNLQDITITNVPSILANQDDLNLPPNVNI